MKKLRTGVIGCGLVAQVMHLHYLRELGERFEIAALCDLSENVRKSCARDYGVAETFSDWRDLLKQPLDAVLVLTPGSHAPIAIAAFEAGLHVLVEKPMCFSIAEGQGMIAAAEKAKKVFMVAYNKRYDPAFPRLIEERKKLEDLRLVRVTTLESPINHYVDQSTLHRGAALPVDLIASLKADNEARITAAIGSDDPLARWAYHLVLLDSMVHEFNVLRGVLGEPDELTFANIRKNGLSAILRFGDAECAIHWVDLPGIARYSMEFGFYSPNKRLTFSMPSPFLRNAPTLLTEEGGDPATAQSYRKEEVVSHAESFKEELLHFHSCITTGEAPRTPGQDGLRDIALCQAIVKAHLTRKPVLNPTKTS